MVKAHFVQHTHWDREWYFTTADAHVLSEQVFTEVLDELARNPKVNFCLDGQSSIVDEYVELHPEKLALIKKLMKEERLFVGPWYTQTDALLVDGESILRNLIIGINDTINKYGQPMMLGYLPDTFGFNAQLPTFLNQVGIDNFLCWRGLNFEKLVESPYFVWQGLGDQFVYAMNFPFGYMTGMIDLDSEKHIEEFVHDRLDVAIDFNHVHGNNEDVLVPSGIDQKNIVQDFDKVLDEINQISQYENVMSSYPEFVETIRQKENLPTYQGELRQPVYSRAHRSIGSVRTRLKTQNFELEQKILRRIEPLMVIAKSLGIEIGQGILVKLWKKVLECQAHDSIGGCVSDNVAEDIHHRFKEANEYADGIENLIMKKMAEGLDLQANEILICNTDITPFTGEKIVHIVAPNKQITFHDAENPILVDEKYYPVRKNVQKLVPKGNMMIDEPAYYELFIKLTVSIPALGYKVIAYEEGDLPLPELKIGEVKQSLKIENPYYELHFSNGRLNLKTANQNIVDFVQIVDAGNAGDTYDYSPIEGEEELPLTLDHASVIEEGTSKTLLLSGRVELPLDLADRTGERDETGYVGMQIKLTLAPNSQLIDGKIEIDNQIYSHRLRLKFNVDDDQEKMICQIQNGFIKQGNQEIPIDWAEHYVEKPVNLYIFDKSVSVENQAGTVTIFAKALRECERIDKHLLITLMATTGELGKPDLAWRPGRASGDTTNEGHIMMPTPLAQEIGKNEFSFAIRLTDKKLDESETSRLAYTWMDQSISYQLQLLNVFIHRLDNKIWPAKYPLALNRIYSLLDVKQDVLVSAIYPAYRTSNAFVLRLGNPTAQQVKLTDEVLLNSKIVDALEQPLNKEYVIEPYDFMTLLVPYK